MPRRLYVMLSPVASTAVLSASSFSVAPLAPGCVTRGMTCCRRSSRRTLFVRFSRTGRRHPSSQLHLGLRPTIRTQSPPHWHRPTLPLKAQSSSRSNSAVSFNFATSSTKAAMRLSTSVCNKSQSCRAPKEADDDQTVRTIVISKLFVP
jgi:hypothetical protein